VFGENVSIAGNGDADIFFGLFLIPEAASSPVIIHDYDD
jgi:hypothetical protein